jgi:hypothetical protein
MLEKYMEQFQKELELDKPLIRPNPGSYYIPLEDSLSLTITSMAGGFHLYSELVELPKENEEVFYTKALNANLFGQGTRGSILGLNDRGNMLTISQVVDYNIEYKDFKDLVDDFINTIDFWRVEVQNTKTESKSK